MLGQGRIFYLFLLFFNFKGLWKKLNTAPVCFGTKDNQFGSFKVPSGGNIGKMKLVHLYGYVSC